MNDSQEHISQDSIIVYLEWMKARGQIWPPAQQEAVSPQLQEPENSDSQPEVVPVQPIEIPSHGAPRFRCVFVSKETWTKEARGMRANLVKALQLAEDQFVWLDLAYDVDGKKRIQLNELREGCRYLIIFGSELAQLLENSALSDQELPLQRNLPHGTSLLLPSLVTMLQQPKRKIAVWELFQRTILDHSPK